MHPGRDMVMRVHILSPEAAKTFEVVVVNAFEQLVSCICHLGPQLMCMERYAPEHLIPESTHRFSSLPWS